MKSIVFSLLLTLALSTAAQDIEDSKTKRRKSGDVLLLTVRIREGGAYDRNFVDALKNASTSEEVMKTRDEYVKIVDDIQAVYQSTFKTNTNTHSMEIFEKAKSRANQRCTERCTELKA